jgi:hypothetical protein
MRIHPHPIPPRVIPARALSRPATLDTADLDGESSSSSGGLRRGQTLAAFDADEEEEAAVGDGEPHPNCVRKAETQLGYVFVWLPEASLERVGGAGNKGGVAGATKSGGYCTGN